MKTLNFTLDGNLKVMVIPDTQAHLDGHTIITHTYSVFWITARVIRCSPAAKKACCIWKRSRPGLLRLYYLSNVPDNPASWKQIDQ
jgi:hypothetical protein